MQQASLKRRWTCTGLHGATTRKTDILTCGSFCVWKKVNDRSKLEMRWQHSVPIDNTGVRRNSWMNTADQLSWRRALTFKERARQDLFPRHGGQCDFATEGAFFFMHQISAQLYVTLSWYIYCGQYWNAGVKWPSCNAARRSFCPHFPQDQPQRVLLEVSYCRFIFPWWFLPIARFVER
jgi:hypothetical protein